jgi:CheY-like chemotaxis protein
LVVDDDADNRLGYVALRDASYRVRRRPTESRVYKPSNCGRLLDLLDVSMPGPPETLRRLRTGAQRDMPVILVTGQRSTQSVGAARSSAPR